MWKSTRLSGKFASLKRLGSIVYVHSFLKFTRSVVYYMFVKIYNGRMVTCKLERITEAGGHPVDKTQKNAVHRSTKVSRCFIPNWFWSLTDHNSSLSFFNYKVLQETKPRFILMSLIEFSSNDIKHRTSFYDELYHESHRSSLVFASLTVRDVL